jgi:HAD superfamily phosphoserine phosphatase-like hydrolase
MATPRMFISSTYSDLIETRIEIAKFISSFDYVPVTFEKNDIPFEMDKPIEDSCYDEIENCSLFILIIKNNFGASSKYFKDENVSSVTQTEYNEAKRNGIPIFVFIHKSSIDEYNSFKKQGMPHDFKFNYLENVNLAKFIQEIFNDKSFRFINTYNEVEDIKITLKKQWAGLFNKYLQNSQKYSLRKNEPVFVNSFKLFYFRRHKGFTQAQLAYKTGISEGKIKKIEDAGIKNNHIEIHEFETLPLDELQKIADALQCSIGNIKAGLPDDFITQYLLYYYKNKGSFQKTKKGNETKSIFNTKAVIFDFDGTLTKPLDNLTTWEKIWLKLGFDINECAELHRKYSISQITHKQWCDLTEQKFKQKRLSIELLDEIAKDLILIEGIEEVINELTENGVLLYICSGSIDYIIKKTLGKLFDYFEEVKSNKFTFDKNGFLKSIIGTRYDFEGKANYISQIISDTQIYAYETFFVGNSLNDEWAHQSGVMTICVNPSMTNPDHPFQWTYSIRNMKNLSEILNFMNYK